MSENIFKKLKAPESDVAGANATVQARLNAGQPDQHGDNTTTSNQPRPGEGLATDSVSVLDIPNEAGPIDSPDVVSTQLESFRPDNTSADGIDTQIIVTFPGDIIIPDDLGHQKILLDSLVYWAAMYIWAMCKNADTFLRGPLLSEIYRLHSCFHTNVESTAEALWLYRFLRRSSIFANQCREAFSEHNAKYVRLRSSIFHAFATYVISVYVTLEKRGLKLDERCTTTLGVDKSWLPVVTQLMDVAYELLRVKKMALPRRESCLRSLNNFFAWMSERGECERRQTNWILANWHIKAALEHWERDDMDVDHFFFAGSSVLHRTRSYDEALKEYLRLLRELTRLLQAKADGPITSKWATQILEKHVIEECLDIETPLEQIHLEVRMTLVMCCFTLWIFRRLWEGINLREALEEEYGPCDLDETVIHVYCWAVRGANLALSDVNDCVGTYLPKDTTQEQYRRLQREMLRDLDYRIYGSWNEFTRWVNTQWTQTSKMNDCLRADAILGEFKTVLDLEATPLPAASIEMGAGGLGKA